MKFFINKKQFLAVSTAVFLSCTVLGILPAGAGLDEVIDDGNYTSPLAREERVEKTAANKPAGDQGRQDLVYRVREGDTLWSIADRSGTTVVKLAMVNGISQEEVLLPGRNLILPGANAGVHKVATGETLTHIAGQYGLPVQDLIEANHLANPNSIKIGQELTIPGEMNREAAVSAAGDRILLGGWAWPVAGEVTSLFGIREDRPHEGVDIGAHEGATISAAEAGTVVWSAPRGTYGLTVIIDNGNEIRSLYAHCSKLLVQEGQRVERGQAIALIGNTGNSAGPHLHMEILRQGIPVDPLMFLKERLFG